ncbi:MAG: hypothetical protein ACXWQR_11890 [Ktedonobacterales bacterium]
MSPARVKWLQVRHRLTQTGEWMQANLIARQLGCDDQTVLTALHAFNADGHGSA